MTSPSPWSIKGIKPEAREAAKEAARKSGMTLGAWMTQQIIAQAAAAEAAAEDAVQNDQKTSADKAGQTRPARAKGRKKTAQKIAPPSPSAVAEAAGTAPEAGEKARRAAVKNALRGAAKAQRTRKRQAPDSAQSIEAPMDPAAQADVQPSPQVSEALTSFSARLDDVEARTNTDDAAAKAAQERAASAESAVQTLSSSVSALRDEIAESRERTAHELRTEVGEMVDVRIEAKTQQAIQRVDEIDASFDEIARTVDAATRRTASTDTSLRRLQETSQDQQALLEAMRAESVETKETLERLAARNSAPAEEVVEQVFNDPRLPTMIRGVVREAIEEIVLDDEFALLAEDAPAANDEVGADEDAPATAARDEAAARPLSEEPDAQGLANPPKATAEDALFLAWSGAPASHPDGPWFTEPDRASTAAQESDDEYAHDAQAQSRPAAPEEQERDALRRDAAHPEDRAALAANAFAQAPENDASDVLDLGQWSATTPEAAPRPQRFDAPVDDQNTAATRIDDEWFGAPHEDETQRYGQTRDGGGETAATQDHYGADAYAPESFDQSRNADAYAEPPRPAARRARAEAGLGAELGALVDQAFEDEGLARPEERFDETLRGFRGEHSERASQERVPARQVDLQAAAATWRGELDEAETAHREQDWPEHGGYEAVADHGRDRRAYSETEQDLIDEAEAFLEAQERRDEPRGPRSDAMAEPFEDMDRSGPQTLELVDEPSRADDDTRYDVRPSQSAEEAMRRAEQSIARLADDDFDDGDFPGLGRRDDQDREPFEPFGAGPETRSTPATPQSAVGAWRARRAEAAAADPVAAAEPAASSRRSAASAAVADDLFDDGLYEASESASARIGVFVTLGLVALTAAGAVVYLFLLGA